VEKGKDICSSFIQLLKPARFSNSLEVGLSVGTEGKIQNLTKVLYFSYVVLHELSPVLKQKQ